MQMKYRISFKVIWKSKNMRSGKFTKLYLKPLSPSMSFLTNFCSIIISRIFRLSRIEDFKSILPNLSLI